MPIDSRQMLLLAVAIAQTITMWPSLLKIIDCFMGCFGFALRPPGDRTYIRRYQIGTGPRNVPDLEAQKMNPLNVPESGPLTPWLAMSVQSGGSFASSTSPVQYRKQRALERNLEHHTC